MRTMAGSGSFEDIDSASCNVEGVREIRGQADASGFRFGIVVSRFNQDLTGVLARSAVTALQEAGATAADIDVVWVPGAFEIPSVLERLAATGSYAGLIALGAVLQGETVHAATIGSAVSRSINEISRHRGVPVIDGVVVAPDREAAETRCLPGPRSRGTYTARAAIEMAHVFRNLPTPQGTP
jgi:6,7-dimethyl-8-ribityllumazine synthase